MPLAVTMTLAASAILLSIAQVVAPPALSQLLVPTMAALCVFAFFVLLLRARVGGNLFGEIGFIYLGWVVVYTVVPGFGLITGGVEQPSPLARLLPTVSELGMHLWRHVLFISSVAIGYLLARGKASIPGRIVIPDRYQSSDRMVLLLLGAIALCVLSLLLMSAPVTNYYEHYVRYEHLSWPLRKFISLCVRLNIGFYTILLVVLFLNYQRYRLLIPVVIVAICVHEASYSLGSRIISLLILIQAGFLYHMLVRRISLYRALAACLLLGVLFTAMEFLREAEFDIGAAQSRASSDGLKMASEFGAVFFTGFHLYSERAQDTLPPTEWPMFFNDFISLVTFNELTLWNPMEWYARNYYPDALVAPMTLSPIADSAIWGGELDLLVRGIVNGIFFALIVRWFLRFRHRWWALVTYTFCYSTAIITLKYSVFYQLTPLLKNMVPAMLIFVLIRKLTTVAPPRVHHRHEPEAMAVAESLSFRGLEDR